MPTDLGTGAIVPASVLSVRSNSANTTLCVTNATCYNFFLLRYRPGTDLTAAAAQLTAAITKAGCPIGMCTVTSDQRPGDIKNYAGIRDTPLVLGAVLVLLAVGTLAHVLLTGSAAAAATWPCSRPWAWSGPRSCAWWPGRPARWPRPRC